MRGMKENEGRTVEEEDEVLEVMAKHWEEFGRKREDTEAEMGDMGEHELVMCEELSWEEVVEVMKCLKGGKTAGPDGIMKEILMYGDGRLVNVMLLMMNVVMKSYYCLLDRKRSLLVLLHNYSDVEQVDNYRWVAISCSVVKVCVRVLARRLGRFAEDRILTEAQGGFRSSWRCSDQWLVLRDYVRCRRGRSKIHI